jgi:four helix bundle protein
VKSYRDLKFWDRLHQLVVRIHEITRSFPKEELVNLTATMRRTAISIPAALVEAYATISERAQLQLLQSAIAATGQLEYQLLLSRDLGYLDETTHDELITELLDMRKQMSTHSVKVKSLWGSGTF